MGGEAVEPSDNLYITGVPNHVTQDELHAVLSAYGCILQHRLLPSSSLSQPNSAAWVRYDSVETAAWLVQNLDGNIPAGLQTPIGVRFADLPKPKEGGGGDGKGAAGGLQDGSVDASKATAATLPAAGADGTAAAGEASDSLYISGLPEATEEADVQNLFGQYGAVRQCKVMHNAAEGPLQAALVRYASSAEAAWVKENLNGAVPQGYSTPLSIIFACSGGKGKSGAGLAGPQVVPPLVAPPQVVPPRRKGAEGDNVYVSGLPGGLEQADLERILGQYGRVLQSKLVYSSPTSCSALVRFATPSEAQWVVANVNGNAPEGLPGPVRVAFHQPKDGGKGKADVWTGGGGKGGAFSMKTIVQGFETSGSLPGSGTRDEEAVLYVSGLPPDAEDVDLYRLFNPFGALAPKGVSVLTNPDGWARGIAFVTFLEARAAQTAIAAFNGTILPDGSTLVVRVKQPKGSKSQPGQPPQQAWVASYAF